MDCHHTRGRPYLVLIAPGAHRVNFTVLTSRQTVEFLDADPSHTAEIAWTPSHTGLKGTNARMNLQKQE
ncbi:hypothetical protein BDP27DRAFT_1309621 [Rhodocollybia butyracea]|uniref:Uncharacterized protein n=1 Tax=Rhodocollybia butyracea TaxID=206335 RepID=A0A9P5UGJ9_9AGAR|nr:hypothetical protein BDP27DRAFT_1309621 [Rhodocollybia butyracea]